MAEQGNESRNCPRVTRDRERPNGVRSHAPIAVVERFQQRIDESPVHHVSEDPACPLAHEIGLVPRLLLESQNQLPYSPVSW